MTVAQETQQGRQSTNGLSANTQIKVGSGRLARVSVTTAGAAGSLYDSANLNAGITAANLIGVVPATVGVYLFDWPFYNGLVYEPGAAQVASITYS
jgi:hypothetical protein